MKHTSDPKTCPACKQAEANNAVGLFCLFLAVLFVLSLLVGGLIKAFY